MTSWNTNGDFGADATSEISATSGKQLAHEFMKLRFRIFDEIGYPGDSLYPSHFWMNEEYHPTGVSNTRVHGDWVHVSGQSHCQPGEEQTCVFHPIGPNANVTCSLGSYPLLPQVQTYCNQEQIDEEVLESGPTKQKVICDGQSGWDIISSSGDMDIATKVTTNDRRRAPPRIDFVQAVPPTHVLVLETTASMTKDDDWKFINKAAHKLIKYDLPDSTRLGVVSFSNRSKLEAPLTTIRGSRGHLADIIPDKYRLNGPEDTGRCVLCGINMAMTEVLGDQKEGAHLILVTRGGEDTLADTDMVAINEYIEYYQVI